MNLAQLAAVVSDEAKAFELVERIMWPNGAICPHCDTPDRARKLAPQRTKPSKKHPEGKPVHGLWKCYACRKQFTVRVGTIFEDSPLPLGKWLLAIHQMCSSKKGISAKQLQRELGISYQASWFMCHRIREAMKEEPLASMLGSGGGIVEIDETFVGGKVANNMHRNKTEAAGKKTIVMTLIDREGEARTAIVPDTRRRTLEAVAKPIVDKSATIMTDGNPSYANLDDYFHGHHAVDHDKQFVRAFIIHTNFAESYHSLLKRGLIGAFHHVSAKHLDRYLNEFQLRWNTRKISDGERTEKVIMAARGKRLTYRLPR